MRKHAPEPIWFQVRPSRILLYYLVLLHAAGATALWLLQAPPEWRALGVSVVGLSLLHHLWTHWWLRGSRAVRRLHWRADGSCWVCDGEFRDHVYREVEVLLVKPSLILARLVGNGRRRWLLLAGDSAEPDILRRLRVRLRRQVSKGDKDQDTSLRGT